MKLTSNSAFCLIAAMAGVGSVPAAVIQHTALSTPKPAGDTVWFGPSLDFTSHTTISTTASYTSNFGVAFRTGSSGPFEIDWVRLDLNNSVVVTGSSTLTVALHQATNGTAYSAVAAPTAYATDSISFTMPTVANSPFSLYIEAADLPNISSYQMSSATPYALIIYGAGNGISVMRRTGFANGTTNDSYTVNDGFVALDTFRNNIPNYTNSANSYPSLGISFGSTSVPEPSSLLLVSLLGCTLLCSRSARGKGR